MLDKDGNFVDGRRLQNGPYGRNSPIVGLRLEEERLRRLYAKADEMGCSRSDVVRKALERFGV